jgi:Piwi domain
LSIAFSRLARPRYVFADGAMFPSAMQGLKNGRPFSVGDCPKEPRILFVFPEEHKDKANELFLALKNGVGPYQGSERLLGFSLKTSNVTRLAPFKLAGTSHSSHAKLYRDAIADHLQKNGDAADLALILHDRTDPHDQNGNPYLVAKYPLLLADIPTQAVTTDLLRRHDQFQWSVANIALAMFAKMGGQPWAIESDFSEDTLIIGINRARVRVQDGSASQKYFGFATTFGHNGVFLETELFPAATDKAAYIAGLEESLRQSLVAWRAQSGSPVNIIAHVDKELDHDEVDAIERALSSAEQGTVRSYSVLKLSANSNVLLFNPANASFAPPPGTMIRVAGHRAILQIGGHDPNDRSFGKVSAAGPWLVQKTRAALQPVEFGELCSNVLAMAAMNWRALNADLSPVSVSYPRTVAELLGRFSEAGFDVDALRKRRVMKRPWFI